MRFWSKIDLISVDQLTYNVGLTEAFCQMGHLDQLFLITFYFTLIYVVEFHSMFQWYEQDI